MITREYQCQKCERVEEYREESDSSLTRPCENYNGCGGISKRIMSAPNVASKGSRSENEENSSGILIGVLIPREEEDIGKDFN